MKIKFCGAAKDVTGSCHLITSGDAKILLDCGQFQGGKAQEALNHEDFPFDPAEVQCLVLSHAHIDHCGRIPLLIKRGFRGKIYCTDATADLLEVMLKDSGYIHEKEAEWKNRKNMRLGRDLVEPLYTVKDAVESLRYIEPVLYDQLIEINPNMKVVFNDAGHILGSAIVELWVNEEDHVSKIVFTGDLGVKGRPILRDPTIIKKADFVIMESTYGNRLHTVSSSNIKELIDIIVKTAKRGGTVVIPSFAVGRTQELIYELAKFYEENTEYKKMLEDLKVYIDSPMATTATEVFKKNAQVFDEEMKDTILRGDDPLDFANLKFTRTTEESKALNMDRTPKVIISASGMCEAGRVRHHLKHNLWDKNSSIVFVGYQAEGSLGRSILDGIENVTLFGETVNVNAEIHNLEGFSAHADKDGLMNWVSGFVEAPEQVFLVHGELEAKKALAYSIKESLGYEAIVVEDISEFQLETGELLNKRKTSMSEITNEESLETIKRRIADVHGDLENLLYSTNLLVGEEKNPENLNRINNIILALEKETMNLGTTINESIKKSV